MGAGKSQESIWPGLKTVILASRDIIMMAESRFPRAYLGFLLVTACLSCLGPAFSGFIHQEEASLEQSRCICCYMGISLLQFQNKAVLGSFLTYFSYVRTLEARRNDREWHKQEQGGLERKKRITLFQEESFREKEECWCTVSDRETTMTRDLSS